MSKGLGVARWRKRPGEILFDALNAIDLPDLVQIHGVNCISNCSQGYNCAARRRPVELCLNLDPDEHVEIILDGVNKYLNAADGLVPWREAEHFRKNCIARIPL